MRIGGRPTNLKYKNRKESTDCFSSSWSCKRKVKLSPAIYAYNYVLKGFRIAPRECFVMTKTMDMEGSTPWHTTIAISWFSVKMLVTPTRNYFVCMNFIQQVRCHHLQTAVDTCQCVFSSLLLVPHSTKFANNWRIVYLVSNSRIVETVCNDNCV